ncbi:MAG: DUF1460 domain-containing protein [Nitrospirae bacterium]|nr:DUF1460 domain-containing protein [Nitrospirota bacterium]
MIEKIYWGSWIYDSFNEVLSCASKINLIQDRLAFLSEHFLELPYESNTLIGGVDTPEAFVINLSAVDCFTFLDHIAAMSVSIAFDCFKNNLRRIRYRQGHVSFWERNHFFTDWPYSNPDLFRDITREIGTQTAVTLTKSLNLREGGTLYVNGLDVKVRELSYLPSDAMDAAVIAKIVSGDYVGIYSDKAGLDVSHVGMIIKKKDEVFIRHASSIHKKVLDESLTEYMKGKQGLIILRQAAVL